MKYDVRTVIIHTCLFIISLVLLQPAIGWGGILGLWILLSVNNYEQRQQVEKLIRDSAVRSSLFSLGSLFSIAGKLPKGTPPINDMWDANDITYAEPIIPQEPKPEEGENDTEN